MTRFRLQELSLACSCGRRRAGDRADPEYRLTEAIPLDDC